MKHQPVITGYRDGTAGADCSCSWSDPSVWGNKVGALEAALTHAVGAMIEEAQIDIAVDFDVSVMPVS